MQKQNNTRTDWPATELRLLLKACIYPVEEARKAWRDWLATRSIDTATWAEVRLLAALAGRIGLIDPQSPARALLEGVRRFVWTRNQIRLDNSLTVIDLLNKAEIPVMVLKGMARIAANPMLASSRYVRDIDIMVQAARLDEASEILIFNDWRPLYGKLPGKSRAEPFARLLPEVPDENAALQGEYHVDLHRSALHFGRAGTFDDILWTRCKDRMLRRRPVKVPSETDQFLHALAHGVVSDIERPVDWVIDALEAAGGKDFSWRICISELQRRHMGTAVAGSIEFLESELGFNVPADVHRIINHDKRNYLFRKEVSVYRKLPADRSSFDNKCMRWAEWLRSRHCLYEPLQQKTTLWEGHKPRWLDTRLKNYHYQQLITPIASYKTPREKLPRQGFFINIKITGNSDPIVRFDLLFNRIWFGRIRIEPSGPEEKNLIYRQFCIPAPQDLINNGGDQELMLILLDMKGRVPINMLCQTEISMACGGNQYEQFYFPGINEVFSGNKYLVRMEREAGHIKTSGNSGVFADSSLMV